VLHLDTTTAQPYRELSVEEVEAADALADNGNDDDNKGENSHGDSSNTGSHSNNGAAQTGTA
jgi:hypothetical protein